jgi:hypothetical protein
MSHESLSEMGPTAVRSSSGIAEALKQTYGGDYGQQNRNEVVGHCDFEHFEHSAFCRLHVCAGPFA